jgi:hypothetical protein
VNRSLDGFGGLIISLSMCGSKENALLWMGEIQRNCLNAFRCSKGWRSWRKLCRCNPDATGRNLTGYDALTFWVTQTATLNEVGFGNSFGEIINIW